MKPENVEYVAETFKIMRDPLTDEPEGMKAQLRLIDGRLGFCYFLLAATNAELDRQTAAACEVLKAQDLKAYALEAQAEAIVSGWRRERDEIQGLIKSIENRIMLGMSIMKDNRKLPQE